MKFDELGWNDSIFIYVLLSRGDSIDAWRGESKSSLVWRKPVGEKITELCKLADFAQ